MLNFNYVIKYEQWIFNVITSVAFGVALMGYIAFGQDCAASGPMPDEADARSEYSWWQRSRYHSNDCTTWYSRGFSNSTKYPFHRVPIHPPLYGPNFGYNQPCWKQIPVERRCFTCEEVPGSAPSPIDENNLHEVLPVE